MNKYFDLKVTFADGEKRTFPKINSAINKDGVLIIGITLSGTFREIIALPVANIKSYVKEY